MAAKAWNITFIHKFKKTGGNGNFKFLNGAQLESNYSSVLKVVTLHLFFRGCVPEVETE